MARRLVPFSAGRSKDTMTGANVNLEQYAALLFTVLFTSWALFILYVRALKQWLLKVRNPAVTAAPRAAFSQLHYRIIAIGGIGGELFALRFIGNYMHALKPAFQLLFPNSDFEVFQPSMLTTSAAAATEIIDRVIDDPRPLILIGHSKGGLDILELMTSHPAIIGRIHLSILANTPLQGSWVADLLTRNLSRAFGLRWRALECLNTRSRRSFWKNKWSEIPDWHRRLITKRLLIIATEEFHSRKCAWPIVFSHLLMRKLGIRNDGLVGFESQNLPQLAEFKNTTTCHLFHHHGYLTCGATLSNISALERCETLRTVLETHKSLTSWNTSSRLNENGCGANSVSRLRSRRYRHLEVIK
ncbi:MAG: hypothetical protein J0L82_06595 [Deltaproteobacteria bacterium]|nr:hypothetical protein [Deltaproteobacteria bacterium]